MRAITEQPKKYGALKYKPYLRMRTEYDFSKAKKNPYASMLKKQVTIRLDERKETPVCSRNRTIPALRIT